MLPKKKKVETELLEADKNNLDNDVPHEKLVAPGPNDDNFAVGDNLSPQGVPLGNYAGLKQDLKNHIVDSSVKEDKDHVTAKLLMQMMADN